MHCLSYPSLQFKTSRKHPPSHAASPGHSAHRTAAIRRGAMRDFFTGKIIIERRQRALSMSAIQASVRTSARSAGSTLPPLTTVTARRYAGSSAPWKSSAAVATAPLGSGTRRVAATMARMAARISASVTVTMPSTKARMWAKLSRPTLCVRRPSAIVRLVSSAGQVIMAPVCYSEGTARQRPRGLLYQAAAGRVPVPGDGVQRGQRLE